MSRARNWAMTAVIVVCWLAVIFMVISLMGCEALQARDHRAGEFTVNADCDEDTLEVTFELEQDQDDQSVEITK